MTFETQNLCIITLPIHHTLEALVLEDVLQSIQPSNHRAASNPLLRHFANRTLTAMQTISDFGWSDYEAKHQHDKYLSLDTRYYDFSERPPPTLYPDVELKIKVANVMPDALALIRKVRREYPREVLNSHVLFWRKLYAYKDIYFVESPTGRDLETVIQDAEIEYRVYGGPYDWISPGIPIWHLLAFRMGVSIGTDPAYNSDRIYAGEREAETGAVSEGRYAEKDHSEFQKTGKSVSAEDIDDLIDRITTDTEENQVKRPEE